MSLINTIDQDIKDAMRARESMRLSALRGIKTVLKNKMIDLRRELTPEEENQALATMAKQRRESIESFIKAQRDDLVQKEQYELDLIFTYLPPPLSESELSEIIREGIVESQAQSIKDMGKVMQAIKAHVTGRIDGKIVGQKVQEELKKLASS